MFADRQWKVEAEKVDSIWEDVAEAARRLHPKIAKKVDTGIAMVVDPR